jgi:hypothetical protein
VSLKVTKSAAGKFDIEHVHSMVAQILQGFRQSVCELVVNAQIAAIVQTLGAELAHAQRSRLRGMRDQTFKPVGLDACLELRASVRLTAIANRLDSGPTVAKQHAAATYYG